jgi:hypothetical protein
MDLPKEISSTDADYPPKAMPHTIDEKLMLKILLVYVNGLDGTNALKYFNSEIDPKKT